ncbi:DUF86 domain-containing protein [Roseateles sp.]|uniref:HepT-like ribonuclease domain-containing protein n=1 Tax=Roseateles sp. TaxID=1971397 RepID=UPI001D5A01FE|nr:DUF86 domain-containing protein [Roseateles sp.]MBV8036525.1 DUF86 domain-containing protein [Roseateles sp.]MBV8603682.1 DUF86 domain-containing protein [Roseateles sp.]
MNVDSRRLPDYLKHIAEAIERIRRYTAGMDKSAFLGNALVQDAVIRNFEILGEASHSIVTRHPEFAAAHPELPLAVSYQMRNSLAHGYFKVDLDIVWATIERDLPGLHARVVEAINTLH